MKREEKKPKDIKITKIRRDDMGHVLSDEPVIMPKENLYYNSEGYIPQENIDYSKKEEPRPDKKEIPEKENPGEDLFGILKEAENKELNDREISDAEDEFTELERFEDEDYGQEEYEESENDIKTEGNGENITDLIPENTEETGSDPESEKAGKPGDLTATNDGTESESFTEAFDGTDPESFIEAIDGTEPENLTEAFDDIRPESLTENQNRTVSENVDGHSESEPESITETEEDTELLKLTIPEDYSGLSDNGYFISEDKELRTDMNKTTGINDGTLTLSQEGSDKEEMKGSPEEKPYDRVIDRSSDKEELEIITDKVDIKDSDKEDNSSYKYDIGEEDSGDIPSGGKDNDNYSWKDYYVPPKHEEKGGIGESESNVFSNIIKALMIGATLFAAVAAGIFIALLDYEKKGVDLKNAFAGTYRIELSEILLKELRAENDDTGLKVIKEEMTGKEDKEEDEEKEEEEKEEDKEEKEEDGSAEEEAQDENPGGMEIASLGTIVNASDNDVISVGSEEKESEPEEIKDVNEGYPLEFREVDYGYFLDALFVGDSRLQGFGMYADLPATYYCVTSFSVYKYDTMKVVQTDAGKVPIFDAIPLDMFTKIYIKVGLNELGGDEDLFFEKYGELIDRLRICEPRAIIYVHGVLPVTAAKSASDKYHNNIRISERNEKLKAFAEEKKAYYIEPSPELLLEDGSLIPESAFDGIHLKAQYMGPWKEYLRKHAIVP